MTSAPQKIRSARKVFGTLTAAIALFAMASGPAYADSATGSYLAARHASNLNDYEFAATYFTRALARDSKNTDLMEQAVLYKVAAGRVRDAVPIARQLVETDSKHRIAQLVLVAESIRKNEFEKAQERLESFDSESFNVITAQLLKGWAAHGAGYFGRYHSSLATAIGEDAEATDKAFKEAIGDDRPSVRMAEAYGRFLERNDRADEAAELYAEAMTSAPSDPVLSVAIDRATSSGAEEPELLVNSAQEGVAEACVCRLSMFNLPSN